MSVRQEIESLLRSYHLRPDTSRGQHFLVDDEVYDDILSAAAINKRDTVLEIGPGLGTLTERLAAGAGSVVAVELDAALAGVLHQRFVNATNVRIVNDDILAHRVTVHGIHAPYKIVANIPYGITASILKKFLATDLSPLTMTLLVQREVGERLIAPSGKMSLLSLSAQLYAVPRLLRVVRAACFLPPPRVDSALIQLEQVRAFPFDDIEEAIFWRVARVGFSARRKQLKNNLANGLKRSEVDVRRALAAAGLDERVRAQELTVANWHILALHLSRG